jgi:hypothetical protein
MVRTGPVTAHGGNVAATRDPCIQTRIEQRPDLGNLVPARPRDVLDRHREITRVQRPAARHEFDAAIALHENTATTSDIARNGVVNHKVA